MKKYSISLLIILLVTLSLGTFISMADSPFIQTNNNPLRQQTEKFLSAVNNELMESFDINNKYKEYILIDDENINSIIDDELTNFKKDDDINIYELMETISYAQRNLPIGSTEPLLMLKSNGNGFVIAYKLQSSENVLDSYIYKKGEWEYSSTKLNGKQTKWEDFE